MIAHKIDDEVVSCGNNDDGRESSSEVVRVVGDRLSSKNFVTSAIACGIGIDADRDLGGRADIHLRAKTYLVLRFFKFAPEFIERVSIRAVCNSDIVDLLETSDVELSRELANLQISAKFFVDEQNEHLRC